MYGCIDNVNHAGSLPRRNIIELIDAAKLDAAKFVLI